MDINVQSLQGQGRGHPLNMSGKGMQTCAVKVVNLLAGKLDWRLKSGHLHLQVGYLGELLFQPVQPVAELFLYNKLELAVHKGFLVLLELVFSHILWVTNHELHDTMAAGYQRGHDGSNGGAVLQDFSELCGGTKFHRESYSIVCERTIRLYSTTFFLQNEWGISGIGQVGPPTTKSQHNPQAM